MRWIFLMLPFSTHLGFQNSAIRMHSWSLMHIDHQWPILWQSCAINYATNIIQLQFGQVMVWSAGKSSACCCMTHSCTSYGNKSSLPMTTYRLETMIHCWICSFWGAVSRGICGYIIFGEEVTNSRKRRHFIYDTWIFWEWTEMRQNCTSMHTACQFRNWDAAELAR